MIIKKIIYRIKYCLILFFAVPILPVCSEMEIWSNGKNFLYLIKDVHIDYLDGRISIKQQADIVNAAKKLSPDAFVLTENIMEYSGQNEKLLKFYILEEWPKSIKEYIALMQKEKSFEDLPEVYIPEVLKDFVAMHTPLFFINKACTVNNVINYNVECNQVMELYSKNDFLPKEFILSRQEVIDYFYEINMIIKDTPILKNITIP